jgi:hypothetical protein
MRTLILAAVLLIAVQFLAAGVPAVLGLNAHAPGSSVAAHPAHVESIALPKRPRLTPQAAAGAAAAVSNDYVCPDGKECGAK